MTNENQSTDSGDNTTQPSFGAKFKAAREALGLKHKDVAIQLRLPERIIVMLEKDDSLNDLPPTFMRGYIRAYGKFLQIADQDIAAMIATIKLPTTTAASPIATRSLEP